MPMPMPVLVLLYLFVMLSLTLIVRRAYMRCRNGPIITQEQLEREIKFPYSPPPERRKRAFDWAPRR